MASVSYRQVGVVEDLLKQIKRAILNLQSWNEGVQSADHWLSSADGMKTLAANCMLIPSACPMAATCLHQIAFSALLESEVYRTAFYAVRRRLYFYTLLKRYLNFTPVLAVPSQVMRLSLMVTLTTNVSPLLFLAVMVFSFTT